MTGSTISGTVTATVTLGSAAYPSPLSITSTGDVAVTVAGAIGLYAPAGAGTLINSGTIIGGRGGTNNGGGTIGGNGNGGVGVDLHSGDTATNIGTIFGGAGGGGVAYGAGSDGAAGVDLAAGAALTNLGTIIGGISGYIAPDAIPAPSAGAGAYVTGGTLTNAGDIVGGKYSRGTIANADQGYAGSGVMLLAGTLTNTGTITGGAGLVSSIFGGARHPQAGNGVYLAAGATLANTGTIVGGAGAGVFMAAGASLIVSGVVIGGYGGAAVFLANGGSLYNAGTLAGGPSAFYPGAGVDLVNGGTVVNVGTVLGGNGANPGANSTGYGGSGVTLANGGTLINQGFIEGGYGKPGGLHSGGPGGVGVDLANGGVVTNRAGGTITGGTSGGQGAHGYTDNPGGGVNMVGGTLTNAGTIFGANAMSSGYSTHGGAGVTLAGGAVLTNAAGISGGAGAFAFSGFFAADGFGGAGVMLVSSSTASTAVNTGSISGGNGYNIGAAVGTEIQNDITFFGGAGASVAAGDTLINSGTLIGGDGISIGAGFYFGNRYAIFGGAGATVASGGTLINSGSIMNGVGVYVAPGGTLTNAGTVGGGIYGGVTADAVLFGGAGTLIDYAGTYQSTHFTGGTFIGQVIGDASAADVLSLRATNSPGTATGLGTQIVNFAQTTVEGTWTLTGANTIEAGTTLTEFAGATLIDTGTLVNSGGIVLDPSTLNVGALTGTGVVTIPGYSTLEAHGIVAAGQTLMFGGSGAYIHLYNPGSVSGTITNFIEGESIDLAGVTPASVRYAAGQLTFSGGDIPMELGAAGTISVAASADGAVVTVICFCRNTQILTPDGERAVQDLAPGDLVTTRSGETREIVWIGTGKVRTTRGRRTAATPVIVRKGALAENVPNRDLHVTKGHAFWFDGVLIPVEFLVNHRLIEWDDHAQEVELYHIELATHDVLIANGAPAESYRDDGNRWLFHNANSGWDLPPQQPCASVLTGGPIVDAVWRRLLDRAGPRPGFALTDNPDLHLMVDGKRLNTADRRGTAYIFRLPATPSSVRIVSRAAAQAELGLARDPRVLGVAIRRIVLRQDTRFRVIDAADAALIDGFYPFEQDNGLRWTDGDAGLPPTLFDASPGASPGGFQGPTELVLHLGATTPYPLAGLAALDLTA